MIKIILFIKKITCLIIVNIVCYGCIPRPIQHSQLVSTSNSELKTISTSVSLVLHSQEQSMAGSGYLVYLKPDKAHIIVLTPFGTTLFEAFAVGDKISLLYPSEKLAFIGRFDELPKKGGLKGWRSIHWALEDAALQKGGLLKNGIMERISASGAKETITVENGLIVEKAKIDGEKIYYSKHTLVNGVFLAHELDLRNSLYEQLRIVFDEPEVNGQIDESAFLPRLDGLKVYPLQALEE